MNFIVYDFETTSIIQKSNYIFQKIKGRKLSDIYHSHDFYECFFIVEGSCTHILNEKESQLKESDCLLLCPGDRHKFIGQSENLNLICLSIKKNEMENFLNVFDVDRDLITSQITLNIHQIKTLLNFYHAKYDTDYKLLLANLIKFFIDASMSENSVPAILKLAIEEMKKAENLNGGTKRFIELSQYSKTHLNRLMKKHYNTTIHDFIFDMRLEAAYNSLILTNIYLEDLAESIGYASFSHFNKIFKNKYGITPAELRKKYGSWTM